MAKVLITSALPYINGVKHIGNLAGSILPADVHARFNRQIGNETLFLCGTDEHGTPAELAAHSAGLPVDEYCRRQHAVQAEIYRRFAISFDHFSRTSGPANHRLTQLLYRKLDAAGFIEEHTVLQPYSATDRRFLQDRLVEGVCPHCGLDGARGDQCDSCGRLLDPQDLRSPRSALSGAADIEFRETTHLFLRLAAFEDRLRDWIASHEDWPPVVRGIALSWLSEGLRDRSITRDLSWGVPVPRPGFEEKVFYVWFDAPIGYIAATVEWSERERGRDWRDWWVATSDVRYVQFLGKDNVPFHTIFFPALLIGTGENWKLPDFIKGLNWLTYDGGKFSTSRGRGIFTDAALDELPADCWRWWLAANVPEGADTNFDAESFVRQVDKDLADTFGNLVHRCLAFIASRYESRVPDVGVLSEAEHELSGRLDGLLSDLRDAHRSVQIRKSTAAARAIWSLANAYLAEQAPWSAIKTDTSRAAVVARFGVNLIRCAAIAAWPFIPDAAEKVLAALGEPSGVPRFPADAGSALASIEGGRSISRLQTLFPKLGQETAMRLKARFG